MIGFPYFLQLVLILVPILLTLAGYAAFNRRFIPDLGHIAGGFISFLAFNELVALPFVIFHISFDIYYVFFILINLPFLLMGIHNLLTQSFDKRHRFTWILALILGISIGLLSQFYAKYDADDSYYVSTIQQTMFSDGIYTTDPPTGDDSLGFPRIYIFGYWEIMQAAIATTFQLSALETAHRLIPLLIIVLVFFAHQHIFRILNSKKYIAIALLILATYLLFSGYSSYTPGSMLLFRGWQGKSILAALIIPILLWSLVQTYTDPYKKNRYWAILLIGIATVALNPTGSFIVAAAVTPFLIMILIKTKKPVYMIYIGACLAPLFITGVISAIGARLDTLQPIDGSPLSVRKATYLSYLKMLAGSSVFIYLLPLFWVVLKFTKAKKQFTFLSGSFLLLLLCTWLNPLLFTLVRNNITASGYWRLFWLIPLTIVIPAAGAYLIRLTSNLVASKQLKFAPVAIVLSSLVVLGMISLEGDYVFNTAKSRVVKDSSISKTPVEIRSVSDYMEQETEGNILASALPATYLHNYTEKHELLIARWLYISREYARGSNDYEEVSKLSRIINSRPHQISYREFDQLLDEYGIDYLVYPTGDKYISGYTSVNNIQSSYSDKYYTVINLPD